MSSVNIAGSRLLAPYMVVVDFTTRCWTLGAFWQAARSCIVPMTLSSFIVPRPPALPGVEMTLMCTTVSTFSLAITLAITGLRMSARTNETSPTSPRGGTTSTPMTRSTVGSAASARAEAAPEVSRDPGHEDDPAVGARPGRCSPSRTLTGGGGRARYLPSLRRWTRVFLSSLRCFFFAMRLRRFLMTEPTNRPFDGRLTRTVGNRVSAPREGPQDRASVTGRTARRRTTAA